MENVIQIQYYQSPCGELILGAYREKLCLCDWKIEERRIIIDRRIQKELQASYKEGRTKNYIRYSFASCRY